MVKNSEIELDHNHPYSKFKGIEIDTQMARALSYKNETLVHMQDGSVGKLNDEYVIVPIEGDSQGGSRLILFEEAVSQIQALSFGEIVVAERSKETDLLETTGRAWALYYHWLLPVYRNR